MRVGTSSSVSVSMSMSMPMSSTNPRACRRRVGSSHTSIARSTTPLARGTGATSQYRHREGYDRATPRSRTSCRPREVQPEMQPEMPPEMRRLRRRGPWGGYLRWRNRTRSA